MSADQRSPNPLQRQHRAAHLPLLLLSAAFVLPLLWLVASSLQPREQVGKVPPEWVPRVHLLRRGEETIIVTPPQPVGTHRVLVRLDAGPQRGKELLVDPATYDGDELRQVSEVNGRLEERRHRATLVQNVPAHHVAVKEWRVSKYVGEPPRQFYVDPALVSREPRPVWQNYPEAVRALTAGEAAKAMPLGKLLLDTRLPWATRGSPGTITFLTYLANTLLVALLGVFGTVLSSALVAYGLSRIRWRGRRALFGITLATMMVPFPVLMVPLYALFRQFGWIGSLYPLWVPAFFGSAFNIFLLRQFFLTIPEELSDAARIDGCSELGMFFRIVLPLSKPALAVVALFQFLFLWNDFLGPLIFLTEPETFTMALGLQQYQSQHGGSEWHLLMGASVLLVLPIIVLFFVAQKTFIQGIATTGIKG
jgi:multiple sugar transport system permease protein